MLASGHSAIIGAFLFSVLFCVASVFAEESVSFTVLSQSGAGASNVTLYATGLAGTDYTIDFGDGEKQVVKAAYPSCLQGSICTKVLRADHIYASSGTYTAKLQQIVVGTQCTGANCINTVAYRDIASTVVKVTPESKENSLVIKPTSGLVPLTIRVDATVVSSYSRGSSLDFGDGSKAVACASGGICAEALKHTYSIPGSYTVTLTGIGEGGSHLVISRAIKVTENPNMTAEGCPALTRTLSIGSRGNDVAALQQFLIEQKFLEEGNTSGYFGNLTKSAVVGFQSAHAVSATGLVGKLTRAAIAEACAS